MPCTDLAFAFAFAFDLVTRAIFLGVGGGRDDDLCRAKPVVRTYLVVLVLVLVLVLVPVVLACWATYVIPDAAPLPLINKSSPGTTLATSKMGVGGGMPVMDWLVPEALGFALVGNAPDRSAAARILLRLLLVVVAGDEVGADDDDEVTSTTLVFFTAPLLLRHRRRQLMLLRLLSPRPRRRLDGTSLID